MGGINSINFKDDKFNYPVVRIVFLCHPETLKKLDMMLLEMNLTRTSFVKQCINESIKEFESGRTMLNA